MRRRVERRRKERVEEELSLGPGIVEMLEQHAARVKHILDVMRALKTDLSSGPPPGHHLEWLITEHPADFAPDPPHERDDRMDGETGMWWTKDYGQRVRTALDKHLQRLTPLWIRLAEFEEQQLEAAIDAAGLLDEKEVVRLTRYEKTIDHLLDRATERPSPCPLPGGGEGRRAATAEELQEQAEVAAVRLDRHRAKALLHRAAREEARVQGGQRHDVRGA